MKDFHYSQCAIVKKLGLVCKGKMKLLIGDYQSL